MFVTEFSMYLPPIIHDSLIDPTETEGWVPGSIETVLRFRPQSRWQAGIIANGSTRSQSLATRCVMLIPRKGRRTCKLALHPQLSTDVVKSMLDAI